MKPEKITKVTIFYDPSGNVYAFSENKEIIDLFEATRLLNGYIKKKVTMNEYQYRSFLAFHQNQMLFLNVLTDGEKSFDFPTTYEENTALDIECDADFNRLLELERILILFPFEKKMREALGTMIATRKAPDGKFGKYNTFEIFVKIFKESILQYFRKSATYQ